MGKQTLGRYFLKGDIPVAIKHTKKTSQHWSLGKRKPKPKWDISTPPAEWLKPNRLTARLTRTYTNGYSHTRLAGLENGTTASGKGLEVSYKINLHIARDLANLRLNIYPREMKSDVHKKTRIEALLATLFLTAPN